MRKEIIATSIQVAKQGAQVYFTVSLPKDALYIDRIETGITRLAIAGNISSITAQVSFQLKPKDGTVPASQGVGNLAGTLQLQGMEQPNLCYTADILAGNGDLDNTLFGFIDGVTNNEEMSYAVLPFAAAHKQVPERIRLINNYMLYGYYRDEIGLQSGTDLIYTVGLYLHLMIEN